MQICVIAILLLLLCRELAKKCTQTSCGEINCRQCPWLVIDIQCKKSHAKTPYNFAFCFFLVLTSAPYKCSIYLLQHYGNLTTAYLDGILRTFLIFFSLEYHIKHFISSTFYDTSPLYSFQISYFRVRQLQNARCMYHH